MRSRFRLVPMAILAALVVTGCATPHYRIGPDLTGRTEAVKTLALLEPDIRIFEVSAGGVREQMDEWSRLGTENVTQAIIDRFHETPVTVKVLNREGKGGDAREIKDILALYDGVSWSIFLHTYNEPTLFPDKKARFDYSVGSLEALLQRAGADALLIVQGEDEFATAGKKALNVLRVLTGTGGRMEGTYMLAALAGRNGDILWFNFAASGGGSDLRDRDSAAGFVAATLAGFPVPGK